MGLWVGVDLMYMMVGVFDLMISFGCLFALCLVVWVLGSLFGCLRVWFGLLVVCGLSSCGFGDW